MIENVDIPPPIKKDEYLEELKKNSRCRIMDRQEHCQASREPGTRTCQIRNSQRHLFANCDSIEKYSSI